ncbi:hypothetical protein LTR16_006033, partial [Cryomyces antarcticus]
MSMDSSNAHNHEGDVDYILPPVSATVNVTDYLSLDLVDNLELVIDDIPSSTSNQSIFFSYLSEDTTNADRVSHAA